MKQKLTADDIVNWWLREFHNTDLDKVTELHPEWDENNNRDFTEEYAVTQEQYDMWDKWFVAALAKEHGVTKKYIEENAWLVRLSLAPLVK